ncbi:HDIG domain-containing protein [Candidatus Kapaibacterium sp.]
MSKQQNNFFRKIFNREKSYKIDELKARHSKWLKYTMLAFTVLLCGLLFVFNLEHKPYDAPNYLIASGNVWEGPALIADFTFPVYKTQSEFLQDRRKATENSFPVFILDENVEETMLNKLDNYLTVLKEVNQNLAESSDFSFSEKVIRPILSLNPNQKNLELTKIQKQITQYLRRVYASGFVNIAIDKMTATEISVKTGTNEFKILPSNILTDKNTFLINAEKMVSASVISQYQPLVLELINKLNTPNLQFSKELTDREIELNVRNVPRTFGYVRKGEIIVQNGEVLSQETVSKINSYKSSVFMTGENSVDIFYYIGGYGHSTIILTILFLYLIIIRKRIYADNMQLSIILGVIVAVSFLAWLSGQLHSEYPIELLITVPALSMLVAIVFDSRTAFYVTVTMGLMVSGIRGNDYVTGISMIFAGVLAAYTVRDIQSRTQIYKSIFYILVGFLISILIFSIERSHGYSELVTSLVTAFINSLMAPLITFGLLFLIERFTDISTDLRIKEFDNLDHPLMRILSEKAPGTYQHTLSVALLAERCAREIGANPLLTKVGAYYHDLGKMAKSEYFTENQMGIDNKHDLINAKRSARIIIEHVAEGIKLAEEYNLPQRIIDFIPMHHGTTLVKHFYAKALEVAPNPEEVHEDDFRYPGPKPKNKETAILMICDFAEAISRLDSKTTEEIEKIIEKNIHDRVLDGQFDECEINLHELSKIKKIIAKNLIGMTHKRVNYKEIPKKAE